jgi:hypothetical protein
MITPTLETRQSYLSSQGFAIGVLNNDDWYINEICLTKDIQKILEADLEYLGFHKVLSENKDLTIFPIVYSDSCALAKRCREDIGTIYDLGYPTVIITGFSIETYTNGKDPPWETPKIVDELPKGITSISAEILKIYAQKNKKV